MFYPYRISRQSSTQPTSVTVSTKSADIHNYLLDNVKKIMADQIETLKNDMRLMFESQTACLSNMQVSSQSTHLMPSTLTSTSAKMKIVLSRLPIKSIDELRLLNYDIENDKEVAEIIVSTILPFTLCFYNDHFFQTYVQLYIGIKRFCF